ncbi:hypothetical protein GS491_16450 [Rhodococcus hoagii]|nr:hypothetical protein [Prescottella equi]
MLTSGIRDFAENLAARPSTDSVATAVHEAFVECVRQDRYASLVSTRDLFVIMTSVPGIRARWMVAAHDLADDVRPHLAERAAWTRRASRPACCRTCCSAPSPWQSSTG